MTKGQWSATEDELLRKYVKEHGAGKWNNVASATGLQRCGKSCRLRWMNHLSPSVRKGPFTEEEEQIVVEFYQKHGSKWSRMAKLLEGRSDNEIKNFWHARARKRARWNQRSLPSRRQQEQRRNLQDSPHPQRALISPPSIPDASPVMLSAIQTLENLSNLRERLSTMFIKLDKGLRIPPLLPLKPEQEVEEFNSIHGDCRRAYCNGYLQSVVMGACKCFQ